MNEPSNATNRTLNFGLPLFESGDKPSWLVDWNGTMQQLDVTMQDIKDTVLSADTEVKNVTAQVTLMHNLVDNIQNDVEVAIADVSATDTDVKEQQTEIIEIRETITTNTTEIHETIDQLSTTVEQDVSRIDESINTINTSIQQIFTQTEDITSRLTMTELEITNLRRDVNSNSSSISTISGEIQDAQKWWDDVDLGEITESIEVGRVHVNGTWKSLFRRPIRLTGTMTQTGSSNFSCSLEFAFEDNARIFGLEASRVDIHQPNAVLQQDFSFPPNYIDANGSYVDPPLRISTDFSDRKTITTDVSALREYSAYNNASVRAYLNVLYYEV